MMVATMYGVWLALLACGDKDGSGNGQGDGGAVSQDRDGDGYTADRDCDDGNASIHPDAAEICDGWDIDCNGATDEADPGLVLSTACTCYPDDDRDGHGDAGRSRVVCAPCSESVDLPLVEQAGDCDDQDATIHPGARERCDQLDNDCDGTTDGEGLTTFDPADPDGEITTWATRPTFFDIFVEEPGELWLCGGTHRMRVKAEMYGERGWDCPLTIRGVGAAEAIIDAEGTGSAVHLKRITAVKFEDISPRNGQGSGLSGGDAGGGIACEDVESLEHYRGTIADNEAAYGGGIASKGCNLYLEEVNLERNKASDEGGAIWFSEYKAELSLFRIQQNQAHNGGGIYLGGAASSDGDGAGTSMALTDGSLLDNASEEGGGAVTVVAADLRMGGEGAELRGNRSTSGAGGVWLSDLEGGHAVATHAVNFGGAGDSDKNSLPELWVEDVGQP